MKQQHTLQPKVRFPEFEGDWKKEFIKKISDFIGGGTPDTSKSEFWQGNIPWISSSDIFENEILKISVSRFINLDALNNSATKLIPKGSLLIVSRVGVGKFAIAPTDICTSQDFTNLILKEDEVNNSFLAYQLFSNKNVLLKISQGTSIKGFTSSDLKSVLVLLPSLPEQQKIADYLSTVDNKINLLEEKKAQLALYKKAMMQKLFSQEIRFKPSEAEALEAYPEWEEKRLGEVAKKMQSGGTPKASNRGYYIDGTIPFLSISDITEQGKYLTYAKKTINKQGIENSSSWIVPINSLIYSMYASVGFVTINKIEIATSQAVMNIILKEIDSLEYIYYYLSYFKKFINRFIETGTQGNINAEIVKNIKLPYPSLPEQQKIAEFLSAIDASIKKVTEQISQTQSFKKAMLQQLFV